VTHAAPTLAVVIPTHNRRASVEQTLRAFSSQSFLPRVVEAIVIADGCNDGTEAIARERWPVPVRVIEQTRQGAAVARNRGAATATAEVLIFLDDDIEVRPGFLSAHAQAHTPEDPARVVIGYLPPDLQGRRDFFAVMLRSWWEAMFDRMRDPGHRFAYSDLLSGNFSIRRSLFRQVGGFDETFQCHEDYELGFRLIGAGARLTFVEEAAGLHHEHSDLIRALQRKRDEGRADVALARRHGGLTSVLPLCRFDGGELARRSRLLRTLALGRPAAGDLFESQCRSMLSLLETARLRTRWRRLLDDLLGYWYWRGVGDALGEDTVAELCRANGSRQAVVYDLDLRDGLSAAVREIDEAQPEAVRLCWGSLAIGTVPPAPGAEPLRGRHLASLLRQRFARPLGETIALERQRERSTVSASPVAPAAEADVDEWCVRRGT
jgi:GT2 family glycosyltransferase